jgi:plastocyanin
MALALSLGCASTRERFAAQEHSPSGSESGSRPAWLSFPERPAWLSFPARPSWLSFPEWPSWLRLARDSERPQAHGVIRGTVVGSLAERGDAEPPRVVVYLEPIEPGPELTAHASAPTVRQREQRFSPAFLVVSVGQSVVFTNEDAIYHRIFSYSDPNAFDLQVLTRGESGAVTLEKPGVVHFYCGLHPAESGTIFVTPSPWFATAEASGEYQIADVPPGQYRLWTWSEGNAPAAHDVTVRAGASAQVDVAIRSR